MCLSEVDVKHARMRVDHNKLKEGSQPQTQLALHLFKCTVTVDDGDDEKGVLSGRAERFCASSVCSYVSQLPAL